MKKMSKQDVETVIFENAKTGEALEFQHEQHKAEYGAKHFWKIFPFQIFNYMSLYFYTFHFKNAKSLILYLILSNVIHFMKYH